MTLNALRDRAEWVRETLSQAAPRLRARSTVAAMALSLAALGQAAAQDTTVALATPVAQPTSAASVGCTKVSIQVTPFEETRHFGFSMQGLADIRGAAGAQGATGYMDLGMVYTSRQIKASSHVDAQGCAVHEVTAGYTPAKLYVASELAHNRCAFNHVLTHEEHHLHLYRTALARLAEEASGPLLEQAQREIQGLSMEQASQRLKALMNRKLDDIRRLHDEFDSEEEYARNARVCNKAIPRIIGSRG